MRATRRLDQMRQAQATTVRSLAVVEGRRAGARCARRRRRQLSPRRPGLGLIAPPSSAKPKSSIRPRVGRTWCRPATVTLAGLLSGSPKKQHAAGAKFGLLRQIGDFGIIIVKDFGSVLLMHPETKAETLAYCVKSMMQLDPPYRQRWGQNLALVRQGGPRFACTGVIVLLLRVALLGHRHNRGINGLPSARPAPTPRETARSCWYPAPTHRVPD